jgi:hypothetical protein
MREDDLKDIGSRLSNDAQLKEFRQLLSDEGYFTAPVTTFAEFCDEMNHDAGMWFVDYLNRHPGVLSDADMKTLLNVMLDKQVLVEEKPDGTLEIIATEI